VLTTVAIAALVAQATTFRIDPAACVAGFDLKATGHTVHGSTVDVRGEITAVPEPGDALKLSGKISIGTASLATGNNKRDATMHNKTLEVASFPTIDFEPERFTPSGPASPSGTLTGTLTGRITIRGQTKPQSISATLSPRGERVVASGAFDVAWTEFGVPDPSFFVVRVDKVAHAHFNATFVTVP
jgi:polyisoprenoid-binding protein YceI